MGLPKQRQFLCMGLPLKIGLHGVTDFMVRRRLFHLSIHLLDYLLIGEGFRLAPSRNKPPPLSHQFLETGGHGKVSLRRVGDFYYLRVHGLPIFAAQTSLFLTVLRAPNSLQP